MKELEFINFLEEKNIDKCKALIKSNLLDFNQKFFNYHNRTLIHLIILHGEIKLLSLIPSFSKINFNIQDGSGLTPLHLAIYCKHYDAFEWLINHGANSEIKTFDTEIGILDMLQYEDRNKKEELQKIIASNILLQDQKQKNPIINHFSLYQKPNKFKAIILVPDLHYLKSKCI